MESIIDEQKNIIVGNKKKVGRPRVIRTDQERKERKKLYQRKYIAKKRGEDYDENTWVPKEKGRSRLNLTQDEKSARMRLYAKEYYQKHKEILKEKRLDRTQHRVVSCMCQKLGIPITN